MKNNLQNNISKNTKTTVGVRIRTAFVTAAMFGVRTAAPYDHLRSCIILEDDIAEGGVGSILQRHRAHLVARTRLIIARSPIVRSAVPQHRRSSYIDDRLSGLIRQVAGCRSRDRRLERAASSDRTDSTSL